MAINTGEADPERAKEAMKDPEIQQILRDPTINKVLQDLQQNPAAGQAAMRDKDIKAKIEKVPLQASSSPGFTSSMHHLTDSHLLCLSLLYCLCEAHRSRSAGRQVI